MADYYLNRVAQPTSEHEVHISTCSFMPSIENRIYLGNFYDCESAIKEAKKHFYKVDGCYYCCRKCHTR